MGHPGKPGRPLPTEHGSGSLTPAVLLVTATAARGSRGICCPCVTDDSCSQAECEFGSPGGSWLCFLLNLQRWACLLQVLSGKAGREDAEAATGFRGAGMEPLVVPWLGKRLQSWVVAVPSPEGLGLLGGIAPRWTPLLWLRFPLQTAPGHQEEQPSDPQGREEQTMTQRTSRNSR